MKDIKQRIRERFGEVRKEFHMNFIGQGNK